MNQLLFAGKGEQLRAQLGNDIAIKASSSNRFVKQFSDYSEVGKSVFE